MIKNALHFKIMIPSKLKDFDPDKFTIVGLCADCDRSATVERIDEDMEIATRMARLSCNHCVLFLNQAPYKEVVYV